MTKKPVVPNDLVEALEWLVETQPCVHRSVGIATAGDSEFRIRFYEGAQVRKEVFIKGVHAFRRASRVVGEALATKTSGDSE